MGWIEVQLDLTLAELGTCGQSTALRSRRQRYGVN